MSSKTPIMTIFCHLPLRNSMALKESENPRHAPDGASDCSHGCSGAAAKPTAAEPVEGPNIGFAPDGATEPESSKRLRAETIPAPLPGRFGGREGPRVSLRSTRGYIPRPHPGPNTEPMEDLCSASVASKSARRSSRPRVELTTSTPAIQVIFALYPYCADISAHVRLR